jgi:hypothetical protein
MLDRRWRIVSPHVRFALSLLAICVAAEFLALGPAAHARVIMQRNLAGPAVGVVGLAILAIAHVAWRPSLSMQARVQAVLFFECALAAALAIADDLLASASDDLALICALACLALTVPAVGFLFNEARASFPCATTESSVMVVVLLVGAVIVARASTPPWTVTLGGALTATALGTVLLALGKFGPAGRG